MTTTQTKGLVAAAALALGFASLSVGFALTGHLRSLRAPLASFGLFAFVALTGGTLVRREFEPDDAQRPGMFAAAWTFVVGARWIVVGSAIMCALSASAFLLRAGGTLALGPALGIGASLAFIAPAVATFRRPFEGEGVEAQAFLRGTFIAFLATTYGMGVYGIFEATVNAPRLSMFTPFGFAVVVWCTSTLILLRRTRR